MFFRLQNQPQSIFFIYQISYQKTNYLHPSKQEGSNIQVVSVAERIVIQPPIQGVYLPFKITHKDISIHHQSSSEATGDVPALLGVVGHLLRKPRCSKL